LYGLLNYSILSRGFRNNVIVTKNTGGWARLSGSQIIDANQPTASAADNP